MHPEIKKLLNAHADLEAWLQQRYADARRYQVSRGTQFELTFADYIDLWRLRRLRQVLELMRTGRLLKRMRHPDRGWVLSWSNKDAREAGVMNKHTACIIQRLTSKLRFYLQKGERHTEAARAKIGAAKRGKPLSEAHKEAIRAARTGVAQSEEHKRKRIAAIRATKQRQREERLALTTRVAEAA
jgi:methylphosphotriester-DNA--protein-cysteine methyltransferase